MKKAIYVTPIIGTLRIESPVIMAGSGQGPNAQQVNIIGVVTDEVNEIVSG